MDESVSPKFTSDSFIPFPSVSNNPTKIQSNNERHLNTSDKKAASSGVNSRTFNFNSPLSPWKSVESYSCGVIGWDFTDLKYYHYTYKCIRWLGIFSL